MTGTNVCNCRIPACPPPVELYMSLMFLAHLSADGTIFTVMFHPHKWAENQKLYKYIKKNIQATVFGNYEHNRSTYKGYCSCFVTDW